MPDDMPDDRDWGPRSVCTQRGSEHVAFLAVRVFGFFGENLRADNVAQTRVLLV